MKHMRPEFLPHNLFINNIDLYLENDPHLAYLEKQKYIQQPSLIHDIPLHIPGVYILTGARQVGKSTLIKLFIKHLLLNKTCPPDQVFYLPCDIIRSFQELISEIEHFFNRCQRDQFFYLFIDEVTYVKDWDRVIKYFAEKHFLQESQLRTEILEGVIASLFRRKFKSFYIKAETEVDLCLITGKTFLPIEIKDSPNLKKNHLKQILKYKTGIIGYKGMQMGSFDHLHVLPLPVLALFI